MKRRVGLGLLGLALAVAGLGPAGGAGGQQPARVRVALPGFENNITPFTISFGSLPNTHDLVMMVYDTLFWSQVKEEPEPWLAESATATPDFRQWTVTVRAGAVWHDGRPVTADDIKFSFDYYLKAPGASGRYAHHVSDSPPYERGEVVDARTVRFYYKAPAPQFKIMPGADLPIIPKHVWENVTEPTKATTDLPVGSGPYKVVEIVPDQRYRLQANTAYFKGKPTVDEIDVPIVRDQAAAFAALRTGEVDFVARNVPPELSEQFASTSGIEVLKGTKVESNQIYWNARKAPLTDPKLRKAISLAVDNQALVDTVLLGKGRPGLDNFVHPDSPWALPGGKHDKDPARAQRMLDEAGYTAKDADGVRKTPDGKRLEFNVLVSSFEPQDIRAVQLVSQQVAPIGVKINPETLDPAALRARRQPPPGGGVPDYDGYVSVLEAHAHVDPDGLYYFFHSPGPKGFGASITGYGNPQFDQLVERAAVSGLAERKPLLHQAQRILAEEVPALMLWYRDGEYAFRPGAYRGWISDLGHGIFTKRSFLPEYAAKTPSVATGGGDEDGSSAGVVVAVVVGLAALVLGGALVSRRRRAAEAVEE
jgi:peptide/nickel transport system substrate-binding protein